VGSLLGQERVGVNEKYLCSRAKQLFSGAIARSPRSTSTSAQCSAARVRHKDHGGVIKQFLGPTTRMMVQHWLDDDEDASEEDYEDITCHACAGVHFVNRKGKVLGSGDPLTSSFP
jgi:hypothetical protein